jgi:hypothetical protein
VASLFGDGRAWVYYPAADVKIISNWLPAHARYYRFIGALAEQQGELVRVQVYGPVATPFQIVAVRRQKVAHGD